MAKNMSKNTQKLGWPLFIGITWSLVHQTQSAPTEMSSESEFQHLAKLGWYCKTQLFVQGLFSGMGVIWCLILLGTANKSG